jgi:hypothetical protein
MTGKENNRRTNVISAGRHMATGRKSGQAAKVVSIAGTESRLTTRTVARAIALLIANGHVDARCRR